jgi:hypothetical protein
LTDVESPPYPPKTPARGRLLGVAQKWLPRLLASATVASVVAWTPFFWAPAEIVASGLSVHFEGAIDGMPADTKRLLREVALVKIDDAHYHAAYDARSPLDRCVMAADLERLFGLPKLQLVAIDFDLSPYRVARGEDAECQKRIDQTLDTFAKRDASARPSRPRLILMKPYAVSDDAGVRATMVNEWQAARTAAGAQFAHVEIQTNFGMPRRVIPFAGEDPALGLAFRQALLNDAHLETEKDRHAYRQIAIRSTDALFSMGSAVSMNDVCRPGIDETKVCSDIKAAIVGSGYSPDDRYSTFAGPRDGVDLHAALAICPRAGATHLQHFVVDVVLGVFLGWVFGVCWRGYYNTVSGERLTEATASAGRPSGRKESGFLQWATPQRPEAAYGWLVWMVILGAVLLVFIGMASLAIFGGVCSTAIFPAGIVIGMFIEAAIVQGPEAAAEKLHEPERRAGSSAHPSTDRRFLGFQSRHAAFKTAVALLFSVGTFIYLLLYG